VTFAWRAALVLVALLALPGAASAGTVSAPGFAGVEFDAAPGETNNVVVGLSGGRLRIEDRGGPIKATGTCRKVGPNAAECANEHLGWLVVVDTGDGNDTVQVNTRGIRTTSVRLGAGDDKLEASGRKRLYGDGNAGNDMLLGGSGPDVLQGGSGADLLDGREGVDQVLYESGRETSGVAVRLDDKAGDGAPNENDDVRAELIEATHQKDILAGNDQDNVIVGHGGGDDVTCAGGTDIVIVDDVFKPASDCENVTTGGASGARVVPEPGQSIPVSGGVATVRVTLGRASGRRVTGRVQLKTADGKLLGEGEVSARVGRREISVPLNEAGTALQRPANVEIVGLAIPSGATAPTSLARTTGSLQPG
jgi:hypothetical protein